jgi:hypothetical protein
MAVVGMVLFAYPKQMGDALGLGNGGSIAFAIVALWIMDIGLNCVQSPAWALILETAGDDARRQEVANSIVAWLGGISSVATALLGFAPLTDVFPFFDSNQTALFWIGAVVFAISVVPCLVLARERPLTAGGAASNALIDDDGDDLDGSVKSDVDVEKVESDDDDTYCSAVDKVQSIDAAIDKHDNDDVAEQERDKAVPDSERSILYVLFVMGFYQMKERMFWLALVFFLINCSLSPFQFYSTDYFGEAVYGGEPGSQRYDEGVRVGSLGFALFGAVTFAYSLVLPLLLRRAPLRWLWLGAQLIGSVALLIMLAPAAQVPAASLTLAALVGLINASMGTISYALAGKFSGAEQSGLMIGVLNTLQVLAQLVANFLSSLAASLTGNTAAGMATGGGFGLVASFVIAFYLIVPRQQR